MTDRERWTVYPLLFMTLGIAVKDRIINLSNVERVQCSTLVVHDRKGHEQVLITATPVGGLVLTQGNNGAGVAVGVTESLTGLMLVDANRKLQSLAAVPTHSLRTLRAGTPGDSVGKRGPKASPDPSAGEAPGDKSSSPPNEGQPTEPPRDAQP